LISEKLGLDVCVIDRAKELMTSEGVRFEELVDELEAARQALEAERETARQQRTENPAPVGGGRAGEKAPGPGPGGELSRAKEQADA
jgi:hypothetical protein